MKHKINYVSSVFIPFLILLILPINMANSNEWIVKDEIMPNPRWGLCAATVDGKIYVIGGSQANNKPLSIVEEYDPVLDKWTKKSKMPIGVCYSSASAVNGKIYVIGGMADGWWYLMDILEYDPKTDIWAIKSTMPMPIVIPCTCVLDDKIYITGFNKQSGVTMEYDPSKDRWRDIAHMSVSREYPGFCTAMGKIYAIGGRANHMDYVGIVEEYDPKIDKWKKKSEMPKAKETATCVANNKIYAVGGWDGKSLSDVEEYDPKTDTWTIKESLNIPRCTHSTNVINGKIYAIGGLRNFPAPEPTVEEYTPEGWPFSVSYQDKLPISWGFIKQ